MTHAPITLFVDNRPDHVRRTLASLLMNPEAADSELHGAYPYFGLQLRQAVRLRRLLFGVSADRTRGTGR